jgi:hypothetical protein
LRHTWSSLFLLYQVKQGGGLLTHLHLHISSSKLALRIVATRPPCGACFSLNCTKCRRASGVCLSCERKAADLESSTYSTLICRFDHYIKVFTLLSWPTNQQGVVMRKALLVGGIIVLGVSAAYFIRRRMKDGGLMEHKWIDRWHVITVNRPPDEVSADDRLPEPLGRLGGLIVVEMRPATGRAAQKSPAAWPTPPPLPMPNRPCGGCAGPCAKPKCSWRPAK